MYIILIDHVVLRIFPEPEPVLTPKEQTQVINAQNEAASLWKNRYNAAAYPSTTTQAQASASTGTQPPTNPPAVATIQTPRNYATSQWASNASYQTPTTVPNLATAAKGYSTQTTATQATMQPQATQQQQTPSVAAQQAQATQPQKTQTTLAQKQQATQSQQTQAQKTQATQAQQTQAPQPAPAPAPVPQNPSYWGTTESPKPTQAPYQTQAATQKFADKPQKTQSSAQNGHYGEPVLLIPTLYESRIP